jgi:tetratricopeptide (TPR) repeat protein
LGRSWRGIWRWGRASERRSRKWVERGAGWRLKTGIAVLLAVDNSMLSAYHLGLLLVYGSAMRVMFFAVLLQLMLLFPAFGQAADFPNKGNYQDWLKATPIYDSGNALIRSGKYAEAANAYRQAIKIYPWNAKYYNNLGQCLRHLGQPVQAETAYKKSISLDSTRWKTYSNLTQLYLQQKRFTDAKKAAQQALSAGPSEDGRLDMVDAIKQCDRAMTAGR